MAACGTAVVITPVGSVTNDGVEHAIGGGCDGGVGPVSALLYKRIRAIQQGDEPDVFNWSVKI